MREKKHGMMTICDTMLFSSFITNTNLRFLLESIEEKVFVPMEGLNTPPSLGVNSPLI